MADAAKVTGSRRIVSRPRLFFGWWVVAAGSALQFFSSALLGQAYGAYLFLGAAILAAIFVVIAS